MSCWRVGESRRAAMLSSSLLSALQGEIDDVGVTNLAAGSGPSLTASKIRFLQAATTW